MSSVTNKDYWNQTHSEDLELYTVKGYTGEEWFGKDGYKSLEWIDKNLKNKEAAILDLGCGNGMYLIKLAKHNFKNLYGIDYVDSAIKLAFNLTKSFLDKKKSLDPKFYFSHMNIMDRLESTNRESILIPLNHPFIKIVSPDYITSRSYDLLHDKGTFDIYFMQDLSSVYIQTVARNFTEHGSYMCVTSCNATETELIDTWTSITCISRSAVPSKFELVATLDYPTFQFGGLKGQKISTAIFQLRNTTSPH